MARAIRTKHCTAHAQHGGTYRLDHKRMPDTVLVVACANATPVEIPSAMGICTLQTEQKTHPTRAI
eukprot:10627869-Lingulodinium_polyedra.AAC.1